MRGSTPPITRRDGPAAAAQNSATLGTLSGHGEGGGIHTVELYRKVRLACRDGMSERAAARHFGVSRQSVRKMLQFAVPPGYRRTAPVRRIKAAKFPTVKSLDSFEFKAIPSLNKVQVLDLARCEWIERRENVIALGPSGTGKTHVGQGLGLAACQRGMSVRFVTAAALVHELMEARDERRLLRLQKQFANHKLLIIDKLGFVPLSKTGAELLFELVSQRYERAAVLITSNLPFDEWTETFGTERLK